ncbi:MAG: Adaptive-response sensory-kinase SasA [Phycisphaerae bacterium]|nr:Adaptive-response sensory-kinase SasA [Phycisphaerae bacterium]
MSLRVKFLLVLFLFTVAVGVNFSAALMINKLLMEQAIDSFRLNYNIANILDLLINHLDDQIAELPRYPGHRPESEWQQRWSELSAAIRVEIVEVNNLLKGKETEIPNLSKIVTHIKEEQLTLLNILASGTLMPAEVQPWLNQLQQQRQELLNREQTLSSNSLQINTPDMLNMYDTATLYLVGMAIVELIVLTGVLTLFRKWMVQPIEEIRTATQQIALGNLDYRLTLPRQDELGDLGVQVNRMAESLQRAQDELTRHERMAAVGEMASVVAHNIRNPLAGIRATAQTTQQLFTADSEQHEQQQRIISTVDSLEHWLRELLHLNRPITLRREAVALDLLVRDLEQVFQPSLRRKNIRLVYQPDQAGRMLEVDRQHFTQAIVSLVDNAIEATPAGTQVTMTGRPSASTEGGYLLTIRDEGPGVPPALADQIFQNYFSTKPGGTGIGLSMARKIIEAHNGHLRLVQPTADGSARGACFEVELPALPKK